MPALPSALIAATVLAVASPSASASVDYEPISHKGLKTVGAASKRLALTLQLGFVANQSGLRSAVKSASDPASASMAPTSPCPPCRAGTARRPPRARRS